MFLSPCGTLTQLLSAWGTQGLWLSLSGNIYSFAGGRNHLNTAILEFESTALKVRAILYVDGFLSPILSHLFNVCNVVRQGVIIYFLHAETQPTPQTCDHLNPSCLSNFIFPALMYRFSFRQADISPAISNYSTLFTSFSSPEMFFLFLLADQVLQGTSGVPSPHPFSRALQSHLSFLWTQNLESLTFESPWALAVCMLSHSPSVFSSLLFSLSHSLSLLSLFLPLLPSHLPSLHQLF